MDQINIDEFLEKYPKLSNGEELLKSEILIMPLDCHAFSEDQTIFEDSKVNVTFYSHDNKPSPVILSASASPIDIIIYLGTIISSIGGLCNIYSFLKLKNEERPINKINITNIVNNNYNYYSLGDFEGTVEEYGEFIKKYQK